MTGHNVIVGQHLLGIFKLVEWSASQHAKHWKKNPKTAARYWNYNEQRLNEATPYGIHPAWCVFSILQEPNPSIESFRCEGASALALHDLLEDTIITENEIREYLKRLHEKRLLHVDIDKVLYLVKAMTFQNAHDEQKQMVRRKPSEIHLLKLYDKTSNLQDSAQIYLKRSHEQREKHRKYIELLISVVKKLYGELNIVIIAEALLKKIE